MLKKIFEISLALLGLSLLLWMAHRIGMHNLKESFLQLGLAQAIFLVAIYALSQFAFCQAWHVLMLTANPHISFWRSFNAYLAGDALNMTVPSANLAGEPVKAALMRQDLTLEQAISSVTVYKYADFISMTLFLLIGWLLHFLEFKLPLAWNIGAGIIVAGMSALSFVLYKIQNHGIYHPIGKWLGRFKWVGWIISKMESAHLIDECIRNYYRHHQKSFAWSVFYNFIAWFGGVMEIYIFLLFCGKKPNLNAALTIETFSMFINNVLFFIPGRLGVGEGGRVLLFFTLGYPQTMGLTYGIIRRIRELIWIGAGMGILIFKPKTIAR